MLQPKLLLIIFFVISGFASRSQVTFQAQATEGCAPFGVVIDVTQPSSGITSYNWTITTPSGTTLTASSPQYVSIFNNPGTYDVSLTINGSQNQTIQNYITVYSKPTATFSVDDNTGCFPHCVEFTDTSTPGSGAIVNRTWDFGNGSTGNGASVSHCYASAGTFSPVLSIADANGCFANITMPNLISVTSNFPTAIFTSSASVTCNAPTPISFTNSSTGNLDFESIWTFGDGGGTTTSGPTNLSHTFGSPGTYEVCLEVVDEENCAASVCNDITILADPNPSFTLSDNDVCTGQAVTFTNTTTPAPSQVKWDFDNNGTIDSFSNAPSFAYSSPGTYQPKFIVIYSPTCTDTLQNLSITVHPGITASISANETTSCNPPFSPIISATASGAGPFTYNWIVASQPAGTTPIINPTFNQNGSFSVSVVITNSQGCTGAASQTNYIQVSTPNVSFSHQDIACFGEEVEPTNIALSNNDDIVSYSWNFDGDGNEDSNEANPIYVYNAQGEYFISLTVETSSGCMTTFTSPTPILVQAPLSTNFTASALVSCAGEAIEYCIPSVNGNTYSWNFDDGSGWIVMNPDETCIEHMYEDTGYFDVMISIVNGACNIGDTLVDYIYIEPPVALFDYSVDCNDMLTVTVGDMSIGADGLTWDFGDGSALVTNVETYTHTYAAYGSYDITLTATSATMGCPDEKINSVQLIPPSAAISFSQTIGCGPLSVFLQGERVNHHWHVSISNGDEITVDWNHDQQLWNTTYNHGGETTTTQHTLSGYFWPELIFQQEGCYDFTVDILNEFGCAASAFYDDAVCVTAGTDFATFTPTIISSCDSVTVSFLANANNITSYQWTFSDGAGTTITEPTHTFLPPYNYTTGITATLNATNTFGCESTVTQTIDVIVPSIPQFNPATNPICEGGSVVFTSTTQGPVNVFTWNFGDGEISNDQNPTHNYSSNGNYEVCLTVENSVGCARTSCIDNAVIVANPEVAFTYTSAINNCLFGVQLESTTPGTTTSLTWDFGDAQTGTGASTFHTYPIGVYDVVLTITNNYGCTDSLVVEDILNYGDVIGPYSVDLDDANCAPFHIDLQAYNVNDTYFTYFWDFNDGNGDPTGSTTVDHDYTAAGIYCPQLIMTDPNGCQVFIPCINPIEVEEFVLGYAQPEAICFGEEILFQVTNADTYSWSGGMPVLEGSQVGEYILQPNVSGEYYLTGTFADCVRTDTIFVIVNQLPVVTIDVPAGVCFNSPSFELSGGLPNDLPGTYAINGFPGNVFEPSMTPGMSYDITYSYTDINGCYNEATSPIFIYDLPVVTLEAFDSKCEYESVFSLDGGLPLGGVYTLLNDTITSFDPALGLGNYNIVYTFTDANSCVNSAQRAIAVHDAPEVLVDFASVCSNEMFVIQNNSTVQSGSISSSIWDFQGGGTSNNFQPTPILFDSNGTKNIHAEFTSSFGCVSVLDTVVNVRLVPDASFLLEDGCQDTDLNFQSTSSVSAGVIANWEWVFEGQSFTDDETISYSFDGWGTLPATLIVTTDLACTDTITNSVGVYPAPVVDILGSNVCMNVLSSFQSFVELEVGSIVGYEWNFGDSTDSMTTANSHHLYEIDGTYAVTLDVTSSLGCVGTEELQYFVYPLPDVDFTLVDSTYCSGEILELIDMSSVYSPSEIVSWSWYLDNNLISTSQNAASDFDAPGLYQVRLEVTTNFGCEADSAAPLALQIYPRPVAGFDLRRDEVLMYSPVVHIENTASIDVTNWHYDFGDGLTSTMQEGQHSYDTWADYVITQTVSNVYGCTAVAQQNVSVLPSLQVHIPNAFTPDGNGNNDFFKPVIAGSEVREYYFAIFDRWGNVVYETEDLEGCWNGQVHNTGAEAQDGVYNWVLKIRSIDQPVVGSQQGFVLLIR